MKSSLRVATTAIGPSVIVRSIIAILSIPFLLLAGCSRDASVDKPVMPKAVPATAAGDPWFEEGATERGLVFHHKSGHRERHLFPEIMCGGAAVFDMDGDGDLDAYLAQSGSLTESAERQPGNQLFRNDGSGRFEDVTAGSGADDRGYGMGVTTGDYDNDGDVDLYVTNFGPNVLLRNDGDGHFTDVTAKADVGDASWGVSAAFVDYDADGDLDLFVVNYVQWSVATETDCYRSNGQLDYCSPNNYNTPAQDTLYRNEGDGTFTDISAEAGLRTAFGNGLGIACADFNGDGRMDIFVANDGMANQLWINQGDDRFEDAALLAGCAVDHDGKAKAGMGVATADIDDDSDMDLLVVNLHHESDSFYRNEGEYFTDYTNMIGLGTATQQFTRFGIGLLDFNNDARLDLYIANGRVGRLATQESEDPFAEHNQLFAGTAEGRFEEQSPDGGTAKKLIATSRAASFGDLDGDGGVDIIVVNRDAPAYLLMNVAPDRGSWLQFKVIDKRGRDALGAQVHMTLGERRLRRDVRAAFSYAAASDPRVHVGLGSASEVTDVAVTWVDGTIEDFGTFPAHQTVTLRYGEGRSGAGR